MKLAILALLFAVTAHAQGVSCGISWAKSPTLTASNVIYLARPPNSATNMLGGAYRFDVGSNTTVRAMLSPGVWNIAVRAKSGVLESAPTLLTFTVPAPVSALHATFPPTP